MLNTTHFVLLAALMVSAAVASAEQTAVQPTATAQSKAWQLVSDQEGDFYRLDFTQRGGATWLDYEWLAPEVEAYTLQMQPEVTVRLATSDFANLEVKLYFLNEAGETIKSASERYRTATDGWSTVTTKPLLFPQNVAKVRVRVGLWGGRGMLDVREARWTTTPVEPLRDAVPEVAMTPVWGQEPIEALGPKRGQMVLNGVWKFMPAQGEAAEAPVDVGWGVIRVPGSWMKLGGRDVYHAESVQGTGGHWPPNFETDKATSRVWYRRAVLVPASWQGQRIILNFAALGTDAQVFLDGQLVGQVAFPGGGLDLTEQLKPGVSAQLDVLVTATIEPAPFANDLSDYSAEDVAAMISAGRSDPTVDTRGLLDDVTLTARPTQTWLGDLTVRTSTRLNRLSVLGSLQGQAVSGGKVTVSVQDDQGQTLKAFEPRLLQADAQGLFNFDFDWADAPRWSPQSPTILTLIAQIENAESELVDEIHQDFGFREFWIEDHNFILNGSVIRLRPAMLGLPLRSGVPQILEQYVDWFAQQGCNFIEVWPNEPNDRAQAKYIRQLAEIASRKGILINGVVPHMRPYLRHAQRSGQDTLQPNDIEAYRLSTEQAIKPFINEPSVVMWGTSGNYFSASTGFLPRNIGMMDQAVAPHLDEIRDRVAQGKLLGEQIKIADPTRVYFAHNGVIGDFDSANTYLNVIPLQEREEWLSEWAEHGKYPSMFVEFGEPLDVTFYRGRAGYTQSSLSEPLITEYLAAYTGPESYAGEKPGYRDLIRQRFKGEQTYGKMLSNPAYVNSEPFQAVVSLHIANTRKAWRTYGHSGGVISWDLFSWVANSGKAPATPDVPFVPGQRGIYLSNPVSTVIGLKPTTIGKTYERYNQPTLAWIAGSQESGFVDKTHHFAPGDRVEKQVVLINDSDFETRAVGNWSVMFQGQALHQEAIDTAVKAGEILKLPIQFDLPAGKLADKVDGSIKLDVALGDVKHSDTFDFRVFAPVRTPDLTVNLFDPVGKTATMLQELGVTVRPWKPEQPIPDGLLVIGREALSKVGGMPAGVEEFVAQGGQCLIMVQDPEWMRDKLGLRVSRFQSRRVFPIVSDHPAVQGLDREDLRDWAGTSTLLEPYPDWRRKDKSTWGPDYPYIGARWGNRHTVSSAAIETPHYGGWTPLLAAEFDLAYSPLLEKLVGKGLLTLCMLDFEDHAAADPAARRLLFQLLGGAANARTAPPRPVVALGLGGWKTLVDQSGLIYEQASRLPAGEALALLGPAAVVSPAELDAFLRQGGAALILARRQANGPVGTTLEQVKAFHGSINVPSWPEAKGLSPADLRWRTDAPAWIIGQADGWEVAADGLLARHQVGKGVAILAQIDPDSLNADKQTYFRFTRWRQTRTLNQLLANLGARFASDNVFLRTPEANAKTVSLYHADYRADFEFGDDPFRFYKW